MRVDFLTAFAFSCLVGTPAVANDVVTYHNSQTRAGAYKVPDLTTKAAATMAPDTGFNATVSGSVYAQPLYWHPQGQPGELIVATENNVVYALNAQTGAAIWHTALPAAVPLSDLACGDINPEGITGTPAIDPGTGTLYFDALTYTNNTVAQKIYAMSLADGSVLSGWPLDVTSLLTGRNISFSSRNQGERSAVLLLHGKLYVVYGGRYGDCQPYNGTVAEFDPASKTLAGVWQTRAGGGGIWAQGGIASDGGSLFVTTGNTFTSGTYGDGESVERLKPGLARLSADKDFYAPANWLTLDNEDADLGGTEALPVDVATSGGATTPSVIAFGKDGNAYLLNRAKLGGIGGKATIVQVSNTRIVTAPAVYATAKGDMVAFTNASPVGCSGAGIMMIKLAPHASSPISVAWCAAYSGDGSPIITTTDGTANPIVWVVGAEGDGELHGFDAKTGKVLFDGTGTTMTGTRHFSTILATEKHLYVPADNKIYAFAFKHG
ncbi:MAG TPA: hypothetical protein VMB71_08230 [Acetobacteraceae bacterium]|nr:hypothetical protein [Acetobacteraceae bacterium]